MNLEDKDRILIRRLIKLGVILGTIMLLPHLGIYLLLAVPYAIMALPALLVIGIIWKFIK